MKCEGNVLILYVKIRDENNSGKLQLHIKVPPIVHLANILNLTLCSLDTWYLFLKCVVRKGNSPDNFEVHVNDTPQILSQKWLITFANR